MLPPFEAILFDYDGTLAVLNLDFAAMRQDLLAFTVAQGIAQEALQGFDILEMLERATEMLHLRQPEHANRYAREAAQMLQDMEVEAAYSSGLLPGIADLLETLRQERIGVGIVTRNCDAAVRVTFPHIDAYCQAFVPRDRVTQVKPHPAHLQTALDCLGIPPSRALMVGDGAMDIQAGKALGMFSIGVLSGNSPEAKLLAQGADLVLSSAADLLPYITQLQRPV
ncbi:MAG: HAD family hydrolase [Candidatus Tectomicrobia bacterium]|uniref:phosphoglycolate phosphatase n=1 Tax=Tectimicrobiota bacterium TaxID=2528274 RepID=A0A937VZ52_UNCTE|nr:HAD family hydrolase [Candidatus Tectomicrobia bacterium]